MKKRKLDVELVDAALKRAAKTAVSGPREARSGKLLRSERRRSTSSSPAREPKSK